MECGVDVEQRVRLDCVAMYCYIVMGSQQNEIFDEIVALPLIRWPKSWQYGACGSRRKLGAALPTLVFSTGVPSSPTMPTRKTKLTGQPNTSPLLKMLIELE